MPLLGIHRYAKIRIADTVNGRLLDGCETVTYESTLRMHDFFVVPGLYEISLTLLEPLTVSEGACMSDPTCVVQLCGQHPEPESPGDRVSG